ncbi:MAG: hypothetical protein Kow00108_17290 [Calditrichia bacterium]
MIDEQAIQKVMQMMEKKHGGEYHDRIEKGVQQVARAWREEDGSIEDFTSFCLENFYTKEQDLNLVFERFQRHLEVLYGHLHQIDRDFNWYIQVEEGEVHPVDYFFANYSPFAHVDDDLFKTKIAFVALLNFPVSTLEEKTTQGEHWDRKYWAQVRLAEMFNSRIPAEINQEISKAYLEADDYISNYNILMDHVIDESGQSLFPEGLKLISHWGLRDELKAQYANPNGYQAQKTIYNIMLHIIHQTIPSQVINQSGIVWNPMTNEIKAKESGAPLDMVPEKEIRYRKLLNVFRAEMKVNPYRPDAPSPILRKFNEYRELSYEEVEQLLQEVVSAPVLKDIAALIEQRLGRDLEPFDIWYAGFKPRMDFDERKLDQITGKKYPTVRSFQQDLPNILQKLSFSPEKAAYLSNYIQVDPSRGAGHATGAMMKTDKAHLRTRIPSGGMKYKGFNIAIHELGHNVEQVFSLNGMDYWTLQGVPNVAFTEAFAFVFQSRDLAVLGIESENKDKEHLRALNDMWAAYEISGVALTDMAIWKWLEEHPDATALQLKDAVIKIAQTVWNTYYAPIFKVKDVPILSIYSHIIDAGLYIPDYPIGHLISFQIEEYLKGKNLAVEMERMCKLGRLAPQIWMKKAVGEPISAKPLIHAAERALNVIGK